MPAKGELSWSSMARVVLSHVRFERPHAAASLAYNLLQRVTYLVVVFVAFPLMIWTGLAMSPAIVSVLPSIVTLLGGHESARTIHFFAADFLVLFLLVHIAMVGLAGFRNRVGAMITAQNAVGEKHT